CALARLLPAPMKKSMGMKLRWIHFELDKDDALLQKREDQYFRIAAAAAGEHDLLSAYEEYYKPVEPVMEEMKVATNRWVAEQDRGNPGDRLDVIMQSEFSEYKVEQEHVDMLLRDAKEFQKHMIASEDAQSLY